MSRRRWLLLVWFASSVWFTSRATSAVAAECDVVCLRGQMDRYVAALLAHDAKSLNLAPDVRFTENGVVSKLDAGLWRGATSLGDVRHVLPDTASQQVMLLGTLNEGTSPAIVALRLAIRGGKLAEIEHVVARKGSHPLFAPESVVIHPALSTTIPPQERLPRGRLIAIADSYFTGIEQHSSRDVLASVACQRIENGVPTTGRPGRGSQNCAASADLLTYIERVDNRRFPIVDAEHGIVVATVLFDIPGARNSGSDTAIATDPQVAARLREPRTLLLTEWFSITDGKIQHIEAVMHNLPHGSRSGWER